MIILKADATNQTYLTLQGNFKISASVTSYFYVEFVNDMTKAVTFLEIVPTAITQRAFQFNFAEPSVINLGNSFGFYKYKVYNHTVTGLSNSDTLGGKEVHEGKMHFSKAGVSEVAYTDYTPTDTVNTTTSNTQYISI